EEGPADVAQLIAYLPHLPPFARLLFVEDRTLKASNPLLKSAKKLDNGYVREFKAPAADELPGWITGRARQKGVDIPRRAASLLASFIGDDLRALDLELEKLAAYVNYARPIELEDVQALVSATQEANIFNLVDALGLRQHRSALSHLRALMAGGANELYVLAMVARQIRLLIAVKELIQARGLRGAELRRALKISHQFVVDKLLRQAEQFRMEELEALMNQLVEVDEAIKTGRIDGGLALEMLTLSICRRPAGEASHQPSNALRSR
ncbi:MAG: DNA polymerase III subunit delta, partial [Chloroflexi bacterium]|nr:DNA polymerase III subunit delta [Chloroflexota bacterium]